SILRSMPCVFRGPVEPLVYAPEIARTNASVRRLVEDELAFRGNSADAIKTAIGTTKQILDETKRHEPEVEQWKADYYAALAVKACLRVGEYDSAKQILSRGLQLEPNSA